MKRNMLKILVYSICIITVLFSVACDKKTQPKRSPVPQIEILPGAGNVSMKPETIAAAVNSEFTTDIMVNSGSQKVAAYGFQFTFNKDIILVDTSKGTSGVEPGPDGYVVTQNANIPGSLIVAGFDVYGKGPGKELNFLKIYWKAVGKGKAPIDFKVKTLVDETTLEVGKPQGFSCEVTVE